MRLHERTMAAEMHRNDLWQMVLRFEVEHGVTDAEMLGHLLFIAGRYQTRLLREERHPDDPSRKADEA